MKYDSELSDPLPVKIGVPQGSVREIRQLAARPASRKDRCAIRLKYDSELSDPLPVKIGVPQGSVREIRQCAVRPASRKDRCATRFST